VVAGRHWFGSTSSALAYLRGHRLIPDAYTKSFGAATTDERPSVNFLLTNWTEQPIKVLGANSSCTCLVTSDLPFVVPPKGRALLKVGARAKSRSGPYAERLRVITDTMQSNLVLYVQGTFR
jgi:hypothetical protein